MNEPKGVQAGIGSRNIGGSSFRRQGDFHNGSGMDSGSHMDGRSFGGFHGGDGGTGSRGSSGGGSRRYQFRCQRYLFR
jgi:hypothetical protein